MKYIKRPDIVKVFADKAMHADYLPVRFGTNRLVNGKLNEIANDNFEYGLEALEGDIQPRDLQSVLFYLSSNLGYLFQQGIAEFSAYVNYPANALVKHDGALWLSTKEVPASLHHVIADPCNPCKPPLCETPIYPSKETGWCKIITSCEYDSTITVLENKDKALEEAISNLKGVEEFKIIPNKDTRILELKLNLSDGSDIKIPMAKFGHIEVSPTDGSIFITNADSSKITLDKPVYDKELDQNRGFYWNTRSKKWEVDLNDLIEVGSGLETDRNGNLKVKPSDFIDGTSLSLKDGKIRLEPTYEDKIKNDTISKLDERGSKVYHDNKGLQGDGSRANLLKLKLGEEFSTDANGNLILANVAPKELLNFTNGKYKLGFHTFTGYVNSSVKTGAIGLPKDINSSALEQDSALVYEDYVGNQSYDYNGYYIASGNELNIWVNHDNFAFTISNDYGVNADGSLKNPNGWGKWQKLDNAGGITNEMIKSMQDQINSLANQVTALDSKTITQANQIQDLINKNNETCKVPVKNISTNYTIVDTDNTIITTNSNPISITLDPHNMPVGRLFTVIQAGSGKVSFNSTSPTTLHAPLDGSLVMAGSGAVVSILFELNNNVRIFGQTE